MEYMEDLEYLKDWTCKIKFMLKKAATIAAESNGKCFFTIGNTTKATEALRPYTTPIRTISNGAVCGVVVFTQTQGILAATIADELSSCVIVDAEKKLHSFARVNLDIFQKLDLPVPDETLFSKQPLSATDADLSAACRSVIKNANFYEYKSNDMTVEGLWHFLSSTMNGLSGRCISIIGGGNIGFKLAIKLVESGCSVKLVRRNETKGKTLVEAINIINPPSTKVTAEYADNPITASSCCDAVIGCTDGKPAITQKVVEVMKPDGILVDVGKGSISTNAVKLAVDIGVKVIRFDVTSAIDGMIATIERNRHTSLKIGRQIAKSGAALVSGGYMGAEGDVVVDDFRDPDQIFGICNGHGDFKQNLSSDEQLILEGIKIEFGIETANC